jgi:hypothetical protein
MSWGELNRRQAGSRSTQRRHRLDNSRFAPETAASMADLGIQPHIIETVLNHVSGHKQGGRSLQSSTAMTSRRTSFAVAMRSCRCIAPKRYGRGLAEAMALGKPVIGTGWSRNLDFMNAETACLVDFRLITVKKDEYMGRFGRNRTWSSLLIGGPDDSVPPRWAAELGRKASRHFSYRARGMAMPPRSCRVARPR